MGYRVYSFGRRSAEMSEFDEAMHMAKEGLARVCDLAEEMRSQYGERHHDYPVYGEREVWEDPMMHERRRRDYRGRYM